MLDDNNNNNKTSLAKFLVTGASNISLTRILVLTLIGIVLAGINLKYIHIESKIKSSMTKSLCKLSNPYFGEIAASLREEADSNAQQIRVATPEMLKDLYGGTIPDTDSATTINTTSTSATGSNATTAPSTGSAADIFKQIMYGYPYSAVFPINISLTSASSSSNDPNSAQPHYVLFPISDERVWIGSSTQEKFSVDLGRAVMINRLVISTFKKGGKDYAFRNFKVYGSNTDTDFSNIDKSAVTETMTLLGVFTNTDQNAIDHSANPSIADVDEVGYRVASEKNRQFFVLSNYPDKVMCNNKPYRYYILIFDNAWFGSQVAIHSLFLQTGTAGGEFSVSGRNQSL